MKEKGFAALSCVQAVLGIPHIRLAWARASDLAEANLLFTNNGKLVAQEKPYISGPSTIRGWINVDGAMNKS